MAYVVGDACIKCKYTNCVSVCPVDCFYEGENALVIHPEECIHCGACEPECPAKAIYAEDELPAPWKPFKHLNALFSGAGDRHEVGRAGLPKGVLAVIDSDAVQVWPNITKQKAPLPNADVEALREHKIEEFSPRPYTGA